MIGIDWKALEQNLRPFLTKHNSINSRKTKEEKDNLLLELQLKLPWLSSLNEAIWSIQNRIQEQPLCEFCQKPALFRGIQEGFRSYCLEHKNLYIKQKREETMLQKYGVKNASNLESRQEIMKKVNQKRKERFASGEIQSWMKGKTKETDSRIASLGASISETKKEKFKNGELNIWNEGLTKDTDSRVASYSKKLKDSWVGREQTEAQKEVTKRFIESARIRPRTKEEFEKQKQTNLEKYGVSSYLSIAYQDGLKAQKKKYGKTFLGSKEWYEKKEDYFNKMRKTNLEKYRVECVLSSQEIQDKIQNTKRINHSFKDSKQEKQSIKLLKEKIREVYVQYKDNRYPFSCDIYLPKFDLFIELNYHWTHGTEAFINSTEQLKVLDLWKEKAKESKYFRNAIQTWTERDVLKLVTAKENNLNYYSFYSYEEFLLYLDSLEKEDLTFQFKTLQYSSLPEEERFKQLLSSYKSYNSKAKYNDLILPFIWRLFYKKELELWKDDEIRRKLIQNRVSFLHKREEELSDLELLRGFSRSLIHKGFSSFSPLVIKSFIRDYSISSIYDPCGGWGHRLLGAWNIDYWYNDFNKELKNSIEELYTYFNKIEKSGLKNFSCEDAALFRPSREFDAVFTCPPYFDVEDYSFNGDSSKLFSTYEDWLNIWWRNVVKNSKEVASIFAYVVSKKFDKEMNKILLEEGFRLERVERVSSKKENHLSISAEENLYIFKRILS